MVTPFFRTGNLQNGTYEILYILISIDCFRETIPAHNPLSQDLPGAKGEVVGTSLSLCGKRMVLAICLDFVKGAI